MWKVYLLLSLVGSAVTTTQEEKTVSASGIPDIPWPPTIPAQMIFPFIPQIVVPIQDDKIVLVLIDTRLEGLHSCKFGAKIYQAFSCTNITLRSGFKAGGGVFDLPTVGTGTISLDVAMDVNLMCVVFNCVKVPVTFTHFKIDIKGLDPGSDMTYLANAFANSLQLDLELVIQIVVPMLMPKVDIECGAENVERLRETLLAEDTYEKYLNVLNGPSETEGKVLETEKTKSSKTEAHLNLENTMRCVEGVIATKLAESEMLQRGQDPTKQLLAFSKTLGHGLEAFFKLYTPKTDL